MKANMDNCNLNKRVRLILGLNEERDWECIKYYKKHEELPSISFSPDADFPCIYAEKGIISAIISSNYSEITNSPIVLEYADCNDNPLNVVPKISSCILKIDNNKISINDFINNLKNIISKYNYEIDIYKLNDERIKLTSYGVQAHSAHPDLGINAISRLIAVLDEIFKFYNINIPIFDYFYKFINDTYDGKKLGIALEDESRKINFKCRKF